MGKGFKFVPLIEEGESDFGRGGGLTEFIKAEIKNGITHLGINGWGEAKLSFNKQGQIDFRKSKITSDSQHLTNHVSRFWKDRTNLNRPFWANLASQKKILIKFFFLDSINTRDLASDFARQSFVSDEGMVIFIYKDVKPYNYGNSLNLMELI